MIFFKKDKGKGKRKQLSPEEREKAVRKERNNLGAYQEKGKLDKALESVRELIQLEPKEPEWRRKLADLYRGLKKPNEELEARCKAATLYAESGFLLKGVAMCKMALALDPNHEATQKKLAELKGQAAPEKKPAPQGGSPFQKPHAQFGKKPAPETSSAKEPSEPPPTPAPEEPLTQEPAAEATPSTPSIPPGAPLESVPLISIVPELPSTPAEEIEMVSVAPEADEEIYVVQLDADPLEAEELEQSVDSMELVEVEDEAKSEEDDDDVFVDEEELVDDGLDRDAMVSALKRTPLLSDLNDDSFVRLVDAVQFRELAEGEVLFNEGEAADAMYAVAEGEVVATVDGLHTLELAKLGEGEFFGEIGLLAEQPRQATITATQPTQLLRFERELVSTMEEREPEFIRILLRFVRERLVASLIATSPLFAPFAGTEATDLTRRFRFLEVKPKKPLIRQGEPSEGVFILLTGGAKVVEARDGESRELTELGPGEIFGEMSLMHHEPAMATVMTTSKSFVLQLPANDFMQLIMMHPSVLAYVSSLASERQAQNAAGGEERISLL